MIDKIDFIKSLESAREYWSDKTKSELVSLLGKDIARMKDFDQNNPHHCFDLYVHSLNYLLLVSAFFHDIGKPKVARKKNDRLVFYGHALKSADIIKKILEGMSFSSEDIEQILFYVTHHDDFISYILPEEACGNVNSHQIIINEKNMKKYVLRLIKVYPCLFAKYDLKVIVNNLLELCMADVRAQSRLVYSAGIIVDSMEHKLKKLQQIQEILQKIW